MMSDSDGGPSRGTSRGWSFGRRRPYLQELLQDRQRRSLTSKQTNDMEPFPTDSNPPTDEDSTPLQTQEAVKYGELMKTSRSKVTNKVNGPPRKRRFRLTEKSLEYFQPFSQIKVRRSFPLTSMERIELVSDDPATFRITFHNFVMELEAPTPFDAKSWVDALNECVSKWTEDAPTVGQSDEDNISNCSSDDCLPGSIPPVPSLADNSLIPAMAQHSGDIPSGIENLETHESRTMSTTGHSYSGRHRLQRHGYRRRSRTSETLLKRQSIDDDPYDTQQRRRKTLRRKLRLAPKLEKQKAISKASADEKLDYKILHDEFAMIKYPRRHRWAIPSEKIFSVDKDNLQVMWKKTSAARIKMTSCLRLDSILEVRLGQQSLGFQRFPYAEVDDQSFSLIYECVKGKYARLESLDLVCDHPRHFDEWIKGLDSLQIGPVTSMFPTRYENTDPTLIWLKRYWTLCQSKHELNERDAHALVSYFNPSVTSHQIKYFLTEAHSYQHEATLGYGNALKWDGFVLLYSIMCGETGRLYKIYQSYALTYKRLGLTVDEFKNFLKNECHWNDEDCNNHRLKELISFHDHHHRSFKKYTSSNKPNNWKKSARLLSFAGFLSFIRSKQNSPVNPLHNTVYQDMDQPLSHYFINSSHNTYLEGDQIKGNSSLDAYVRALLLGSRCIEIDCWDNNLGSEPIIYHGYTLTTKLNFSDVVQTIKDYAFQMSHYPLIISIENHCSSAQQARMASIFVQELKDQLGHSMLVTENLVEGTNSSRRRLPSPLELQGKILLKGSWYAQSSKSVAKSASKASRALFMMKKTSIDLLESKPQLPSNANTVTQPGESLSETKTLTDNTIDKKNVYIFEPKGSVRREGSSFRRQVKQHHGDIEVPEDDQELLYTETSDDLKKLIQYCRSTSIKPWSWTEQRLTSICQMFSFSEISLDKHCKKSPKELLRCTERQLVRTYPRGSRIDSSNYDPIFFWNFGIHMVALNYQTPDMFMHLNQGRFRQNGGCGYVLKPEIMRKANPAACLQPFDVNMKEPHPLVPACHFEIELLSGQNLSPFGRKSTSLSITISLHGIPEDNCEMPKAETVDPFWPQWPDDQHVLTRRILMPELCLLYIRVTSDRSLLISQNCIAVTSLCPGIKFIQLRKTSGELVPESGIFVRLKIKYEEPVQTSHQQDSKEIVLETIETDYNAGIKINRNDHNADLNISTHPLSEIELEVNSQDEGSDREVQTVEVSVDVY